MWLNCHFRCQTKELPILNQLGLRTRVHPNLGTNLVPISTTLDFGQLASPFRLLSIAARWHFLFDKMLLFLNNKCNLPSNTKIAHNSTNINKIDILTVLQDSFIHEEYNDIFNDTKYAAEAAQNHCLVCQRNPCKSGCY